MNILPVNCTTFKGKRVPYDTVNRGEAGIRTLPDYYSTCTIHKTLDSNHSIPKNAVYFAFPMEYVPFDVQRNVDFVVYDNEPAYPKLSEIKENYLGEKRVNYRDDFETIRNYFYRREMGGYADVNEAKNGQKKAAICTGMYDDAGDLRYKKETAEDAIKLAKTDIEKYKNVLADKKATLKEYRRFSVLLSDQKNRVNKALDLYDKTLNSAKTLCEKDKEIQEISKRKEPFIPDITIGLTEDRANLRSALEEYLRKEASNNKKIETVEEAIQQIKDNISKAEALIRDKNALIEDCKIKLEPMFNALAEHIRNFKV